MSAFFPRLVIAIRLIGRSARRERAAAALPVGVLSGAARGGLTL